MTDHVQTDLPRRRASNPVATVVLPSASQAAFKPIEAWATLGGALLLLQIYVWTRWITGPYFVRVPAGVSDPPMYMKIMLTVNATVMLGGLPIATWIFIIKPWLRERRITTDGMLFGATGLMFFQDPLLNYLNTWCTYNAWLFNMGSWSSHIPGWVSPEEPGHQVPEPLLINVAGYMWGVLMCTIVGCIVMRKIKTRWPNISNFHLILATYAYAIAFDFVMEACIVMPIGLYAYPGAIRSVSVFAGTYYQWPIYEGFMWGGVQAAMCCLRYFTDDHGRTVVERGLDKVGGGSVKQNLLRFLAIFAACSTFFFFFYNLPAQWMGMHADPWPEDVLKRSYFAGPVCGEGSPVPCPDPNVPVITKRSGYINAEGKFVLPEGKALPKVIPFERPEEAK
jgi:hypothetical protein